MKFQMRSIRDPDTGDWKTVLEGSHHSAQGPDGPLMVYMTTTTGATKEESQAAARKWAREEATGERDY